MRYFDQVLSEALNQIDPDNPEEVEGTPKSKKFNKKKANELLNRYRKDTGNIALQGKFDDLRDEDPDEFADWYDENRQNPDYISSNRQGP